MYLTAVFSKSEILKIDNDKREYVLFFIAIKTKPNHIEHIYKIHSTINFTLLLFSNIGLQGYSL